MKSFLPLVGLVILLPLGVDAQENSLLKGVLLKMNPRYRLMSDIHSNPAQRPLIEPATLSDFGVRLSLEEHKEPILYQDGRGRREMEIGARTYVKQREDYSLWGHAAFTIARRWGLKWISSADPHRLYPYFLADTVGGKLTAEAYAFGGGVARSWGRWHLGGEADYRAAQEFRVEDPRPRNITSDLTTTVGVAYDLRDSYSIGVDGYLGSYQQKGDVSFYKVSGGIAELQMDGLGTHYARFDGGKSDLLHVQSYTGVRLTLLPRGDKGLMMNGGYCYSTLERVMYGMNKVPINRYYLHEYPLTVIYTASTPKRYYAVGASVRWSHKQGWNNIISESTGDEYRILGKLPMFADVRWETSLFGHYSLLYPKRRVEFTPSFTYYRREAEYLFPPRTLTLGILRGGLTSDITFVSSKALYRTSLTGGYSAPIRKEFAAELGRVAPFERRYAQTTYKRLTSHCLHIGLEQTIHYALNSHLLLFTKLQGGVRLYDDRNRQVTGALTTGIYF